MPADARIENTSLADNGQFNQRSMRDTMTANEKLYGPNYVDPINFRKPEMFVYIYSVVDERPIGAKLHRSFPPLVPHLEITEIKKGEKYAVIGRLPHPMNQPLMRENGERYIDSHDARRVAMDIVNPENLTLDQDYKVNPTYIFSQGNDYGKLGVFWSLFPKPTDEEIDKAVARKEAFYRARLDQAKILEMTNPRALAEYLTINDRIAADYFHEETTWHKHIVRPAYCPNCQEPIREGAAFHASAALAGVICVIDWKAAVKAGVKTREQVPPECRWWTPREASREAQIAAESLRTDTTAS